MLLSKSRVTFSLILFIVTLSLSGFSIFHNRQLQYMGGMAEEYFHLGVNLHYSGKYTLDNKTPFIFRPPGYPFFIASVLKIWGGMPDINATFKSNLSCSMYPAWPFNCYSVPMDVEPSTPPQCAYFSIFVWL
jgi:hypothetical protein